MAYEKERKREEFNTEFTESGAQSAQRRGEVKELGDFEAALEQA
jgi:hypothetical protein